LSIRDRYLAYAASMSALIAGRSPGIARCRPGIAGVLSGVVVVTGGSLDLRILVFASSVLLVMITSRASVCNGASGRPG
jgi:hypothetical protein